ncbi:MAG: hypothetical protein JJE47_11890 [Acidimicrobiia bacterium]|nr:hypothetical protein [Acidimicrobiia bacterium]
MARAFVTRPDVALMSEPASAYDLIATLRIEELMTELKPEYPIGVVTHNTRQVAWASDRAAFFNAVVAEDGHRTGRLVEYGDMPTIFTNPRQKTPEDYITGRFG